MLSPSPNYCAESDWTLVIDCSQVKVSKSLSQTHGEVFVNKLFAAKVHLSVCIKRQCQCQTQYQRKCLCLMIVLKKTLKLAYIIKKKLLSWPILKTRSLKVTLPLTKLHCLDHQVESLKRPKKAAMTSASSLSHAHCPLSIVVLELDPFKFHSSCW